jgi:4-hydroxymandelate oxidase
VFDRYPCGFTGHVAHPSRSILWGLTVAGKDGAANVLNILGRELDEAMPLCGWTTLANIDASLLKPRL